MEYLIWVVDNDSDEHLCSAAVPDGDAAYLNQVIQTLQPMSMEQYSFGLSAILTTAARFSYVLSNKAVYWCIEWVSYFIVVEYSLVGEQGIFIRATAI